MIHYITLTAQTDIRAEASIGRLVKENGICFFLNVLGEPIAKGSYGDCVAQGRAYGEKHHGVVQFRPA